jgi:biopolymer transport protein ExbB
VIAMAGKSFFALIVELFLLSWFLIPLMLLLFILALSTIIERAWFFRKNLKAGLAIEYDLQTVQHRSMADLQAMLAHYANTLQGALLKTAVHSSGTDAETMERQLDEAILWQMPKLDRNLWIIDTSVTMAPLLGLLGTILGMIESFNVLGRAGTDNPGAVMSGVAYALIATALGLLIAIVNLVFLNFFNKKNRLALHQLELIKIMLINRFHGADAARTGSPTTASNMAGAK